MTTVNLQEILHPEIDILFLALNPPKNSNNTGKYFSNNMSFWNLLYRSNLISQPVENKLSGETEVFRKQNINFKNAVYGVTDLVNDIVETNSNKVLVEKHRTNRILQILEKHPTKILCIMHSSVAYAFADQNLIKRNKNYGSVGTYNQTQIYEVPFHNASIANEKKDLYYSNLKNAI